MTAATAAKHPPQHSNNATRIAPTASPAAPAVATQAASTKLCFLRHHNPNLLLTQPKIVQLLHLRKPKQLPRFKV
jgi:hypothetical protein